MSGLRSLYCELVAAGCTIDNHESDLYVRASSDAIQIAQNMGHQGKYFRSDTDGKLWIEFPFQFDPFWESIDPKVGRHE